MRVFMAIPSMETVPIETFMSFVLLQKPEGMDVKVGNMRGALIYNSRNELARQAIAAEADYVLWIDSDMVFAPDLLQRMMKVCTENDISFLTALCFRRKPPFTPTLFDRLDKMEHGASYTTLMSVPEGRFKVGGCGFAGVLMTLDVLLSVSARFGGRMFDPMEGFGEDVAFCWRARQCGYDIWCDSDIEMGHVGQFVVTRQIFEASSEEQKQ